MDSSLGGAKGIPDSSATPATEYTANGPLPILLLSHGAGPCFFTTGGTFEGIDSKSNIAQVFRDLPSLLPRKPSSCIVITAHHETEDGLVIVGDPRDGPAPSLLYDYGGFPPETYRLRYPGANAPQGLVEDVCKALGDVNVVVTSENRRGWDHGVFVPLILMFPNGLPTLSLSLRNDLDPAWHQKVGCAIGSVRHLHPDCLIVASGSVTHGRQSSPGFVKERIFVDWFEEVLAIENARQRSDSLRDAQKQAPHFALCHSRTEHYIPFVVGAAAALTNKQARKIGGGWWHSLAVFLYLIE